MTQAHNHSAWQSRIIRLVSTLVGLLLLLTLFGYSLPSQVQLVDTNLILKASSAELFPFFDSRTGQQRMWTQAWSRMGGSSLGYPPMDIADLGGPDAGAGTRLGFFPDGKTLGSIARVLARVARGYGVIAESEPDRRVIIDIDFKMVVSRRIIGLEALDDNTTKVSWSETLQITNPLMRYLPLLVDLSANEAFNEVLRAAEEIAIVDRDGGA